MSEVHSSASSETAITRPDEIPAQHNVWHSSLKDKRNGTLKKTLGGLALITVILWTALPFCKLALFTPIERNDTDLHAVWGSTYLFLRYFHQLTVAVVDFDGDLAGQAIVQAAQMTNAMPNKESQLGFDILSASQFPEGPSSVFDHVGFSNHWGALLVYPNCTSTWRS